MANTFGDTLRLCKGSLCKARRQYIRDRRWTPEQWYVAWQTTELPNEVAEAATRG